MQRTGAVLSPVYATFITVTGPTFVVTKSVDGGFKVKVATNFPGQSYVVLTSCKDTVNDDTVATGPAIVESSSFERFS